MDIIAFCKDWDEPKTSNNHVIEELAKRHRVLWVNSISTRAPNLTSSNDLGKIVRKLASWFRGVREVNPNIRVLTPIVIPIPSSPLAQKVNRVLTTWLVRRAAHTWRLRDPELWIFPPNAVDFVGRLGESRVVYYCVDEWSQFRHIDASLMRRKEDALLSKADAVFVVSRALLQSKRGRSRSIHLVPHGVRTELFTAPGAVPADMRQFPRPVIGFHGNLYDWVDQDLIRGIALARPDWTVVLIGKIMCDVSRLRECANVKLMGYRMYEELPAYCSGFDVGIIPYRMDDPRMESVNPLKLREYLAAGLPVVSVDLPEVRELQPGVLIADGVDEFVRSIERAMQENSPDHVAARKALVSSDSWERRVEAIERILAGSRSAIQ